MVWQDNEEGEEKSVERRLGALRSCILSFLLLPHRCRRPVEARNVACFDFASNFLVILPILARSLRSIQNRSYILPLRSRIYIVSKGKIRVFSFSLTRDSLLLDSILDKHDEERSIYRSSCSSVDARGQTLLSGKEKGGSFYK